MDGREYIVLESSTIIDIENMYGETMALEAELDDLFEAAYMDVVIEAETGDTAGSAEMEKAVSRLDQLRSELDSAKQAGDLTKVDKINKEIKSIAKEAKKKKWKKVAKIAGTIALVVAGVALTVLAVKKGKGKKTGGSTKSDGDNKPSKDDDVTPEVKVEKKSSSSKSETKEPELPSVVDVPIVAEADVKKAEDIIKDAKEIVIEVKPIEPTIAPKIEKIEEIEEKVEEVKKGRKYNLKSSARHTGIYSKKRGYGFTQKGADQIGSLNKEFKIAEERRIASDNKDIRDARKSIKDLSKELTKVKKTGDAEEIRKIENRIDRFEGIIQLLTSDHNRQGRQANIKRIDEQIDWAENYRAPKFKMTKKPLKESYTMDDIEYFVMATESYLFNISNFLDALESESFEDDEYEETFETTVESWLSESDVDSWLD